MAQRSRRQEEKKKKKTGIVVLVIILIVIAAAAALYFSGVLTPPTRAERDRAALAGQLPGKSQEDIEAVLNQKVAEGMLNITINPQPVFENGDAEGNWNIENIPGNHYSIRVRVTRDDTGDVVYESKLIDPGYYIEKAKLATPLPAGQYPCTAVFMAVDLETDDELGTAAAKVTLNVLK
ncbi:hypothetical protein CE91St36_19330 [Christensenellaceae bacterium]|nr:hypothetical protein CE91St36_19330 [Christensenellaceae bacterium]BDF61783.1 hypothetical protein CE91St37_19330 [Christensenellaceae bacterium]